MDYGTLISGGVKQLSQWFANGLVIGALCGLIIFSGVLFGAWGAVILHRLRRDCSAVRKVLEGVNVDVCERFEFESLASTRVGRRVRFELAELTRIRDRLYRVVTSASSTQEVLSDYISIRMFEAIPNVFIGVGLFATFLGLALALWSASVGAASGDITILKQSVLTLLEFSAAKFTLSLFALLASIILGLVRRSQRTAMDRQLRHLWERLDQAFPRLTIERLQLEYNSVENRARENASLARAVLSAFAENSRVQELTGQLGSFLSDDYRVKEHEAAARSLVSQLFEAIPMRLVLQKVDEIDEKMAQQVEQLTTFNSSLAIQLGEALDNKLQPMLHHLTDRVETALRDLGGSIGNAYDGAFKELLESFVSDLRDATKSDAAELRDNTQALADELGRASRELSERMAGVFETLNGAGSRFASLLDEAGAAFGSGVSDVVSRLEEAGQRSSVESASMLARFAEGASSFREQLEGGGAQFAEGLDRGVRSIDEVVSRMAQSVDVLGRIVDRAQTLSEMSAARLTERTDALQVTLAEVDASFGRVGASSDSFHKAAEHVRGAIDLLRVTQTSVQAKVAALEAAAKSVADSTETFSASMESSATRLVGAINEIASHSESAGSEMARILQGTLEEYERRFARIDAELQQALETIVTRFATTYSEMRERVSDVDKQMAEAVNRLATSNEEFGQQAEQFTDSVASLIDALGLRKSA